MQGRNAVPHEFNVVADAARISQCGRSYCYQKTGHSGGLMLTPFWLGNTSLQGGCAASHSIVHLVHQSYVLGANYTGLQVLLFGTHDG